MKRKTLKGSLLFAMTLLSLCAFAQITTQDLEQTTNSTTQGIWRSVKTFANFGLAAILLSGAVGLFLRLKANSVLRDQGDQTKPVMGFVVMLIVGVAGLVIVNFFAQKLGFN